MTPIKTIGISTVCIVVLWGVCSAGPTTRHPEDEFAELSQAEEECLKHGKFYSDITKKCHELLSTGPCADNERFVLRKRKNPQEKLILKAECKKSTCGDKKLWSETNECVSATDKEKLCGASPKVALSENHFGEGECSCIKVPPHARLNDDPDEDCYELYQRGPCSYKQILAIPVNGTTPQCIEDKCYKATLALREEDEDRRRTAVWYKDGCYELEKAGGPCPNNGTLKISVSESARREPRCEILENAIGHSSGCYMGKGCGSVAIIDSYNVKNRFFASLNNQFRVSKKNKRDNGNLKSQYWSKQGTKSGDYWSKG